MSQWLNTMGKVAIVIGRSSGIGEAIVKALLSEGVKVTNFDLAEGKEKLVIFTSRCVKQRTS